LITIERPEEVIVEGANHTGKGFKDRDLMSDTGGTGKATKRREPGQKPSRTDCKNVYKKKNLTKTERKDLSTDTNEDKDVGGDKDVTRDKDLKRARRGSVLVADAALIVQYGVPLLGKLEIDRKKGNEWGKLAVNDVLRDTIFKALNLQDTYKKPKYSAHISVFDADEVAQLPKKMDEEGQEFVFFMKDIATCDPDNWEEVDDLYFVTVESEQLEQLRASYGFTPLMNEGKHPFHITLAIHEVEE
jgi:hypothetical protein